MNFNEKRSVMNRFNLCTDNNKFLTYGTNSTYNNEPHSNEVSVQASIVLDTEKSEMGGKLKDFNNVLNEVETALLSSKQQIDHSEASNEF
jgi:hypothetical protein